MSEALVTVFLRNRGQVLLIDRGNGEPPAAISRPSTTTVESTGKAVARDVLEQPTGVTVVRTGAPQTEGPSPRYPVLLDVEGHRIAESHSLGALEWAHPTDLLTGERTPHDWRAYRAVSETPDTVRSDSEHGSTTLSIRALEALRDRSAELAHTRDRAWNEVAATAEELVTSRPELSVLATRVDRVMSRANGTVAEVEASCRAEIERASDADLKAATRASPHCRDATILSLSRSGTVTKTLTRAAPEAIVLLESRPACEAIPMAESLADGDFDVTLTLDAALGHAIQEVDLVLVGADRISPDGALYNKIGTRTAAIVAEAHGVPVIAVTAIDKIRPESTVPQGDVPREKIYAGNAAVSVSSPLLDRTDAKYFESIVSDRGALTPDEIERIAEQHRANMAWRSTS